MIARLFFCILFIPFAFFAQVGINTTTPSSASVLDVNSSSDGVNFGGFMPPVVASLSERSLINAGISDIGLIIFLKDAVNGDYCLQMWTGSSWEDIHCITTPLINDIASQDFDSNTTWTYNSTPAFYNVAPPVDDIWDIVSSLPNISLLNGNFLGCRDLNNPNGGGNFLHSIIFNNVNVTAYTNVQVTFDYDVFGYDNGDDVFYELFLDNISQGNVQLINGVTNLNDNGTVVLNVPGGTTNVRLTVSIIQNGDDDTAGFDNFKIIGS